MPIVNGKYKNPGWLNNQRPAINAAELNAISDTLARLDAAPVLPTLTNPGTAGDLLAGKQLIDQNGNVLTGTMPTLAQQTSGTATAADIASGKTAWVNGIKLTGTATVGGETWGELSTRTVSATISGSRVTCAVPSTIDLSKIAIIRIWNHSNFGSADITDTSWEAKYVLGVNMFYPFSAQPYYQYFNMGYNTPAGDTHGYKADATLIMKFSFPGSAQWPVVVPSVSGRNAVFSVRTTNGNAYGYGILCPTYDAEIYYVN